MMTQIVEVDQTKSKKRIKKAMLNNNQKHPKVKIKLLLKQKLLNLIYH
jgi:hypothetical protein